MSTLTDTVLDQDRLRASVLARVQEAWLAAWPRWW